MLDRAKRGKRRWSAPLLEQEHFEHYDNNSTYITPEDWPQVDELIA
jgi:hypothetical protein